MKIDGGCHCGNITYEATADPKKTLICHCTDCQIISGSAYRTIVFISSEQFTLLSGELKTYLKVADSGNSRTMAFCENCGSHLYACDATDNPEVLGVRLGTCNQRDQLKPVQQYYCKSKLSWTDELNDIPILS